jgi:hypothetical protein
MSCRPTRNCAPCGDCPQSPPPVLPRCDNVLPDGVYTNASITVENGCISSIVTGDPAQYTPDPCCAVPGGEGPGGPGLPGDPGPPGPAATVQAGTVTTVAPGLPATVTNVGTTSNAIFNFEIPRGADGPATPLPGGLDYDTAGIVIEGGLVQQLPLAWPPIHTIDFDGGGGTVPITLTFTKDSATGIATATIDTTVLMAEINSLITAAVAGFQAQIDAQQTTINTLTANQATLQSQYNALNTAFTALQAQQNTMQSQLDACCPGP